MSLGKIVVVDSEEWCGLPQLNIPAIKVRVDSGAKTSALYAINIIPFKKDCDPWVRHEVHSLQNDGKTSIHCESPLIDKRKVKSSSGVAEIRYVVRYIISIAESTWEIKLILTNRDSMGYRMLLGRRAMSGKMLVDPAASFQLGELSSSITENYYHIHIKKKSCLKIDLLASNPNLYSNRRIIEAGEEHGHQMEFLNIKDCYIKLDGDDPEMHYRGGQILKDFDAIIPRIRPGMTFYGCALSRRLEALGVYTQNSSASITQSQSKLYSLQLLINSGLPIPTNGFANSPLDTEDLIQMVAGAPLIVKLLEGIQGRGVVLAETKKTAESLINAFKSLRANISVQEYIKKADGKDIWCFVVNGKIVERITRNAALGEFKANIHLGGTVQKIKTPPKERKKVILAAKSCRYGYHSRKKIALCF